MNVTSFGELFQSIGTMIIIYFSLSPKALIIEEKENIQIEMLLDLGNRIKNEDTVEDIMVSNLAI